MVMRNRHDGANAPGWWDDLPPGVKKRCSGAVSPARTEDGADGLPAFERSHFFPVRIARDLSGLTLLFFSIAFGLLLLLFLAASFLYSRGLFGR